MVFVSHAIIFPYVHIPLHDLPPVIIPLVELELLSLARAGWLLAQVAGNLEHYAVLPDCITGAIFEATTGIRHQLPFSLSVT